LLAFAAPGTRGVARMPRAARSVPCPGVLTLPLPGIPV